MRLPVNADKLGLMFEAIFDWDRAADVSEDLDDASETFPSAPAAAASAAGSFPLGLLKSCLAELQTSSTVEQTVAVLRTINRGCLQDLRLFSKREAVEAANALAALQVAILRHVEDSWGADLVGVAASPADRVFDILHAFCGDTSSSMGYRREEISWKFRASRYPAGFSCEALNALLLVWDAIMARGDAPHTTIDTDTGIAWYDVRPEVWNGRYRCMSLEKRVACDKSVSDQMSFATAFAKFLNTQGLVWTLFENEAPGVAAGPAGAVGPTGLPAAVPVATLRCGSLIVAAMRLLHRTVDQLSNLCNNFKGFGFSKLSKLFCKELKPQMQELGRAVDLTHRHGVGFLHGLANCYREFSKDDHGCNRVQALFFEGCSALLNLMKEGFGWPKPGQSPLDLGVMQALWRDMTMFSATPYFGPAVAKFAKTLQYRQVGLSDSVLRAVLGMPAVKTKELSKLLYLHRLQAHRRRLFDEYSIKCWFYVGDSTKVAGAGSADGPADGVVIDFGHVLAEAVVARGADLVPAVMAWVLTCSSRCTVELFRALTRALRGTLTTRDARGFSANTAAFMRRVVLLYDRLAAVSAVGECWMEALDVVEWARYRTHTGAAFAKKEESDDDDDGGGELSDFETKSATPVDPLRTYALCAPQSVLYGPRSLLQSVSLFQKLQAEQWTLNDMRRVLEQTARNLFEGVDP